MLQSLTNILKENNISSYNKKGIAIVSVKDPLAGIILAKTLLYALVDKQTALYLSGGSTPKVLYDQLAQEEKLIPGAVGLVDERYGNKFHEKSNELMIRETGFLEYLQMRAIPFYPILSGGEREQTARTYDATVRQLTATFQKRVAVLGIGADGHTSGIAPNRVDFHNPFFDDAQKELLVSEFDDPKSFYGERIAMTFLGLSLQDVLIVLAFGPEKKKPLSLLFHNGSEEEVPARFFKRANIAPKTMLITDQEI